jgi:hypothetical protein
MLHYLERHASLLGPFVSYKEEYVANTANVLHSQHYTFFLTYEWAQSARVYYYIMLARDKSSSLLGNLQV